jgi:hypothetical protein
MAIACMIRCEIDPFKKDVFRRYALNWGRIIPDAAASSSGTFCRTKARTTSRGG